MSERRRRASMDGVYAKFQRAQGHLRDLHTEVSRIIDMHPDCFVGEIHGDGTKHVYRASTPPRVSDHPQLALTVGVYAFVTHNMFGRSDWPWVIDLAVYRTPLERGKIVAKVVYSDPVPELQDDFGLVPEVAFGKGMPFHTESVIGALTRLSETVAEVCDDLAGFVR